MPQPSTVIFTIVLLLLFCTYIILIKAKNDYIEKEKTEHRIWADMNGLITQKSKLFLDHISDH
jgi:hypothetical protein